MKEEQAEPLLIRPAEAMRILGISDSTYYKLIREGKIQSVGEGKMSRTVYSSIKAYVSGLVAKEVGNPRAEGGVAGGIARAASLTRERRVEIAKNANAARWRKWRKWRTNSEPAGGSQ